MSAAVLASSAFATLTRLDGYMASTGYDADHPWRSEVAAALATFSASESGNANMRATITPSQCPIHHATSALDSIEWSISLIEEIASMVAGIHAMAELPLERETLTQLKRRVISMRRLALSTAQFVDERLKVCGEIRDHADEIVENLNLSLSECWMEVHPEIMPPFELAVVAWDSSRGKPCAVWRNPDTEGWFSQEDGSRYDDDDITHWRYCNAPDGADSEGAPS